MITIDLPPLDLQAAATTPGFFYLGSPYSKYPSGIEEAFRDVCRAAGWLVRHHVRIYVPIAHTHPIAIHGDIDPLDHRIWLPADQPLMDTACGLIVCKMATWESSYGLQQEIEVFRKAGKPIYGMEWPQP